MRDLKVGDKVDMKDGSWSFGVNKGEYSGSPNNFNGDRDGLTVIETDLRVMKDCNDDKSGTFSGISDILVTDGKSGFWFAKSSQCKLCDHTIEIDGKKIEMSAKSYENLKQQLLSD